MSEDFRTIEFEVIQVRTDPTPYKIYAPELRPVKRLIVPMRVSPNFIFEETEDTIYLRNAKCLVQILSKWSSQINSVFQGTEE